MYYLLVEVIMERIKLNDMEIKKLIIIKSVIDNIRTGKEASVLLNISERQIWRLVRQVK